MSVGQTPPPHLGLDILELVGLGRLEALALEEEIVEFGPPSDASVEAESVLYQFLAHLDLRLRVSRGGRGKRERMREEQEKEVGSKGGGGE